MNNTEVMTKSASVPKNPKRKSLEFLNSDDGLTSYYNDIRNTKSLTKPEEQALVERIKAGDNKAIKLLVESNLKFVVAVCRNYRNQGLSMGDLISEGNLGLMRAARRFDGGMNFKFITYAVWWVRQGILAALAEQTRVVKLSPIKIGLMQRIAKATRDLSQSLGRQPAIGEVAAEMRVTEKEIDDCLYLSKTPLSLSRSPNGEEDGNQEVCISDANATRTDALAREWIVARSIERMLKPLPDREMEVIKMFYGIGSQNALTLTEIGARFNVSCERIRQIKRSGLRRLMHPSKLERISGLRD